MQTKNLATTTTSKDIKATPEILYQAFATPQALEAWLAPGSMTGKISNFKFKPGGGYTMSLFYPSSEKQPAGKTTEKEDRYTATFTAIIPNKKIVQSIIFDSADPAFADKMFMEVSFDEITDGTRITLLFKNIPSGISAEDNEKGTKLTLDKLARFVEK